MQIPNPKPLNQWQVILPLGTDLLKPATAATGGRVKKAGDCVKLWLAGIYFLVHADFVA